MLLTLTSHGSIGFRTEIQGLLVTSGVSLVGILLVISWFVSGLFLGVKHDIFIVCDCCVSPCSLRHEFAFSYLNCLLFLKGWFFGQVHIIF